MSTQPATQTTLASGGSARPKLIVTSLAALGVVFGDIGTSPLYAFRECFGGNHAAPIDPRNLTGAASLIVWALVLVVSVKYLLFILKLDNRGEGGILALAALVRNMMSKLKDRNSRIVLLMGVVGASLLYADGMLTPAISVLSAVEGLSVSAPMLAPWVVSASVVILLGLFAIQRFGTGKVGVLFGPIVLLWFITIGGLGVVSIAEHPRVLLGLSPLEGVRFVVHEWNHAFPLLAAVFLAVTGGEALYADLGHFGAKSIRLVWFVVVLPALVLNYLGQAAALGEDPTVIRSPFFLMAPVGLRFPLTLLATAAAVIASQALISGVFSLSAQAIQLGCLPRFKVKHTSAHEKGQVYLPMINWALAVSCCLLVIGFGTSTALAGAYGIAIALTMVITSMLFFYAATFVWKWSWWKTALATGCFLLVDGGFLAANMLKVLDGGLFPLTVAAVIVSLMLVWLWGRGRLYGRFQREALPVDLLLAELEKGHIHRVPGTAVYMSGKGQHVPTALIHNLKHNQVLHQRVLLLHVVTLDEPYAPQDEGIEHLEIGQGLYQVILKFGFAETPDVPKALRERLPEEIRFQPGKATYFLGSETYGVGRCATWFDRIRLVVFAFMARNASSATAYFKLPPGRVVELGAQITL